MTVTAIKDLASSDKWNGAGGQTGFGTISYNGFAFSIIRNVKIQSQFVYDDAGLTITHVKYVMSVRGFIYAEDVASQQTNMNDLHLALSESGQQLVIEDIGFDSKIDTARTGVTPDLIWGAKPLDCQFRPLGGNVAWEFVWKVEFNISRCESASASPANRFMAFNYELNYSTDEQGFVQRAISGYVQIAQNRVSGSRAIAWDIEAAWDRIVFRVPVCFRRLTTTRSINSARNRIDFNIVDDELRDLPYPAGIIEADADYDFENQGRSFENWIATLSVDFEVAPGYPPSLAANRFFLMMADKTAKLRAGAAAAKGAVIPLKLRISTKPFGRRSRFQVIWQVVACLKEILKSSGLYEAVPGTSYQLWAASMVNVGIWNPRGRGGWRHTTNQDAIIDICSGANLADIGNDQGACLTPIVPYQYSLLCPPGNPYIHFENEIWAEQSQNVVIHKLSQLWEGITQSPTAANGTSMPFGSSSSTGEDHISQFEGSSNDYVMMIGRAIRLGKAPDVPRLVSIGGVPVEEIARKVIPKAIAQYFGCAAIGARWAILYRVRGQLSYVKPPVNQDVCFVDGEDDGIKLGN